jgi:hypothetical protein
VATPRRCFRASGLDGTRHEALTGSGNFDVFPADTAPANIKELGRYLSGIFWQPKYQIIKYNKKEFTLKNHDQQK